MTPTREQIEQWRDDEVVNHALRMHGLSPAWHRDICDLALAALELRERAAKRAIEAAERRAVTLPYAGQASAIARQVGNDIASSIRALPLTPPRS